MVAASCMPSVSCAAVTVNARGVLQNWPLPAMALNDRLDGDTVTSGLSLEAPTATEKQPVGGVSSATA